MFIRLTLSPTCYVKAHIQIQRHTCIFSRCLTCPLSLTTLIFLICEITYLNCHVTCTVIWLYTVRVRHALISDMELMYLLCLWRFHMYLPGASLINNSDLQQFNALCKHVLIVGNPHIDYYGCRNLLMLFL